MAYIGGVLLLPDPSPAVERVEPRRSVETRTPAEPVAGAEWEVALSSDVPEGQSGPTFQIKIRSASGAEEPFEIVSEPLTPRSKQRHRIPLPSGEPALPLSCFLVSDDFCVSPGIASFEVGSLTQPYRLRLERGRRVPLDVRDGATGQPLSGVALLHHGGKELTRTDEEGHAVVTTALRRDVMVVAQAEGFFRGGAFLAEREQTSRTVSLLPDSRGARLRLRVALPDGAPVSRGVVSWEFLCRPPRPGEVPSAAEQSVRALYDSPAVELSFQRTRTDEEGIVELPLPLPGTLKVEVSHSDFGPADDWSLEVDEAMLIGTVLERELTYPPFFDIVVETRREGEALPFCTVQVYDFANGKPTLVHGSRTDEDGRGTVRVRDRQQVVIAVRPRDMAPVLRLGESLRGTTEWLAEAGQGANVRFRVKEGEAIRYPENRAELRHAVSGLTLGFAEPDSNGDYELEHVPLGVPLRLVLGQAGSALGEAFQVAEDMAEMDLGTLDR